MQTKFLNFRIDKLTSSIENRVSGEIKETKTFLVSRNELNRFNKKNKWFFSWKNLQKDYPDLDIDKMQINLIQSGDRILNTMSEKSSAAAEKFLLNLA